MLEKLLELENETGMELITIEELKTIDKMWDEEGDLSCRRLVDTYFNVKGKKLPWDEYKVSRFDKASIEAMDEIALKYDIPAELITKLIVSVDNSKNLTNSNKLQKSFDQIISQGWLHYDTVKEVIEGEN